MTARERRTYRRLLIQSGRVDEFVAHLRFGAGEPVVNLDFVFTGLVSSYLKDMSPIRDARGRGSLSLREFNLFMESSEVIPELRRHVPIQDQLIARAGVGETADAAAFRLPA